MFTFVNVWSTFSNIIAITRLKKKVRSDAAIEDLNFIENSNLFDETL